MSKSKTVFLSRSPNQRVIVEPRVIEAQDTDGKIVRKGRPGLDAQFEGNRLETDDAKVIKYLRDADQFNTPYGWYEEGNAPDEPKPTRKTQSAAIAKAAKADDLEELQKIRSEEAETHNRADILEFVDASIANIQVPQAEALGKIQRASEPAEFEDGVGKVDPVDVPSKVEPEIEREKIIKSLEVAEKRAVAQTESSPEPKEPPKTEMDKLLEAEAAATTAEETEKAGDVKPGSAKHKDDHTAEQTEISKEDAVDVEVPLPESRPEPVKDKETKQKKQKKSSAKKAPAKKSTESEAKTTEETTTSKGSVTTGQRTSSSSRP